MNSRISRDTVADVLIAARQKGIRLWLEHGQLHYRVPKGVITQEEIERLRISSHQIVDLLERASGAEAIKPRLPSCGRVDRVPLTFSQLSRWHHLESGELPALRQIASATRLRGRLNIEALRRSVAEINSRHSALRTRIVVCDGVPLQEIAEPGDCDLSIEDLTSFSEGLREVEVSRRIEQLILEPVDVTLGPLFAVQLLRLCDDEHVLIVAMEHMIADGVSLGILERDLFAAYMQAVNKRVFSLPAIPVQFSDYAVWQRNLQELWIKKHGAYWSERLRGCPRLRFPEDRSLPSGPRSGWGTTPILIEKELKTDLYAWCRERRTTLVLSLFTAYVALVLRWCNASESVIRYQSDGRIGPELENTIGFFASVLHLRLGLLEDDSFIDLMARCTEEYCLARERSDFSYIETQVPPPEFTRNTAFNWIPEVFRVDPSESEGSEDAIACFPIKFASPSLSKVLLDHEPTIALSAADNEIVGNVYFPLNRFSVETMERFCRNFVAFIGALLRQPEGRIKDILLL